MTLKVPFIAVEGVDYSGKTTLVEQMRTHYELVTQRPWLVTHSWAGDPELKEIATSHEMEESARFGLAQLARQHTTALILDELSRNPNYGGVITDRWYLSSVVYQGIDYETAVSDSRERGILEPTATHVVPISLAELEERIRNNMREEDDNYWHETVQPRLAYLHARYQRHIPLINNLVDPFGLLDTLDKQND